LLIPIAIPVHPYLKDHQYDGKVILPTVEILQLLAGSVLLYFPSVHVHYLTRASFDRFLYIESGASCIEASIEIIVSENSTITSKLTSVININNSVIKRIKDHATVHFVQEHPKIVEPTIGLAELQTSFEISAKQLYTELIPFGPAFQTVQDVIYLNENSGLACVKAPANLGASGPLGSPFPFDGALHIACAWSQRYCGVVAFPVRFEERIIVKPIFPGETISSLIIPISVHKKEVTFDIWLYDLEGCLREMARGVTMKDVSGGRMIPPQWVLKEIML
jgi:hypothetical protein